MVHAAYLNNPPNYPRIFFRQNRTKTIQRGILSHTPLEAAADPMRGTVILTLMWSASTAALAIRPLLRTALSEPVRTTTRPTIMVSPVAQAGDDDSGCELIGEEAATGTEWWTCEEPSEAPSAACAEEQFGTGGGPGYLPQDGQVLCKVDKMKDIDDTEDGFRGFKLPKMPWDKDE